MTLLLDSFWRAVAYCLHPRVIALSFLPLVLMVALSFGLGYFYWDPAVEWVRAMLDSSSLLTSLWGWLERFGASNLKTVVAPLIVIFAVTPVLVLVSLLVVAALMTPALTSLVAERRFAALERKRGGSFIGSMLRSLGVTLLAIIALVVSMPLWLIPPLILVLPPLIWGWLTYRVMSFDALADHASANERRELLRRHRGWLLGIGVLTGYLGAAPSIVWASGALFAAAFVILVPVAIWIYTLVFAFSSLWFAHYCLDALQRLRQEEYATTMQGAPSTMVLEPIEPPTAPSPERLALPDDPPPPAGR
ncbi:EI24 domain-containing protein [Variovorax sp. VNK109]|uniref:EI24 domain-containing protein n=1 Tax=Variovorax sp. VNK109 TaxID=3400919 RepID=UPI003C0DE4A5